jgi:hypothetical protein
MRHVLLASMITSFAVASCVGDAPGEPDVVPADPSEASPPTSVARDASMLPQPGSIGTMIEGFADYDSSIDSTSMCGGKIENLRPGPAALREFLPRFGIAGQSYYACQTGFHPRGQALDIYLFNFNAMQGFANWLTDNNSEMARRLGLNQVIFNSRMWRSYNSGASRPQGKWGRYGGADPHTNHVHISFGEEGASGTTSFFRDVIGDAPTPEPSLSTFTECGALHVDQVIGTDKPLMSCDGRFRLAQQLDGNLVLYRNDGAARWASGTNGTAGNRAIMQSDGNFVIYTGSGYPVWNSATYTSPGADFALQDDGNMVLYRNGVAIWNSGTNE